jgi:hypothetical protein
MMRSSGTCDPDGQRFQSFGPIGFDEEIESRHATPSTSGLKPLLILRMVDFKLNRDVSGAESSGAGLKT